MLPAVIDQMILATARPTIAADLGGLSDVSWVVTVYVVAVATITPLWGRPDLARQMPRSRRATSPRRRLLADTQPADANDPHRWRMPWRRQSAPCRTG